MYKILSINPGSTSTKFAVYDDESKIYEACVRHTHTELCAFFSVNDQFDFRKKIIINSLLNKSIPLNDFSAVIGRGGLLRPLQSGVYYVNENMLTDLLHFSGTEHASNLGAFLAYDIAMSVSGCLALIADPVVVDEYHEVARISGLPSFARRSMFHALSHKAAARKYALSVGKCYEELKLVVAHLGGGISVAAHFLGKVIDSNQGLDGYGPFSPERAGTLDAGRLVDLCFSGSFTKEEVKRMIVGEGGLMAHLGTNDVPNIEARIAAGDAHAALVMDAMIYSIVKEVGAMIAVLKADVDAIIITGAMAHSAYIIDYLRKSLSLFSNIVVYPGEDEVEALALSALRVLRGGVINEY